MSDQDGAIEQQQITPEVLQRLMQQTQPQEQQPAQRNPVVGGLSMLLPTLNDLEFIAFQGDLQATVNYWLRAKGLLL